MERFKFVRCLGKDMSRPLPVNNSYYPLPIGAYGSPSRSPPPLRNHLHWPQASRSESDDDKKRPPTSSIVQEDTGDAQCTGSASCESPFVRHPDLWFPDGSVRARSPAVGNHTNTVLEIVLRAENTLFRVHKSLLARHSGFFHDLFTLPQPEADVKSQSQSVHSLGDIEGCQVLQLHDAPEDVANLLIALVDGP